MREKLLLLQQEVIGKLKAFQRATVARIDRIFRDKNNPQYRVLVADEVGLGKTMIARGVIAMMAVLRQEKNKISFSKLYMYVPIRLLHDRIFENCKFLQITKSTILWQKPGFPCNICGYWSKKLSAKKMVFLFS